MCCCVVWCDGMFVGRMKMFRIEIMMCTLGEFHDVWAGLFVMLKKRHVDGGRLKIVCQQHA